LTLECTLADREFEWKWERSNTTTVHEGRRLACLSFSTLGEFLCCFSILLLSKLHAYTVEGRHTKLPPSLQLTMLAKVKR